MRSIIIQTAKNLIISQVRRPVHTFGDVSKNWLENIAKVKNRSWRQQRRQLELHVYPKWKNLSVQAICRSDVHELLDEIDGVVLPNRVLAIVKTILGYAVSRGWITASPADYVRKRRREMPRDRVLSMKEIAMVWSSAKTLGYPFGSYVQILLLSAQRRTEVASMRWADLDFNARTWKIASMSNKSNRAHTVPLPKLAWSIIDKIPRKGDFVFTTNGRAFICSYSKIKASIDKDIEAKAESLADWRFHDLRRSAATHMVRLGSREETIARVLNHALAGITATTYNLYSYQREKSMALMRWARELDVAEKSALDL